MPINSSIFGQMGIDIDIPYAEKVGRRGKDGEERTARKVRRGKDGEVRTAR